MTLIDPLPPEQRRQLRRLRKRIAKRHYTRRVREERKLLYVGRRPAHRCRHVRAPRARRLSAHRLPPPVTELRRHEAIVAGGETDRSHVRYTELQLWGAATHTTPCGKRPAAAHRMHGEQPQHRHPQPKAVDGGEPPCPAPRWFLQRLAARVRQRSICPECRTI